LRILVTGGAGFIGSHVAEAYLNQGHKVVILDNLSNGHRSYLPKAATFVKMDLRNRPGLLALFKKYRFQVVNNHAAQTSVPLSVKDPVFDAASNVMGLLYLLEAGRIHGLKRFIHISSGGTVYGEGVQLPAKETEALEPLSPYGISKAVGEDYLRFYQKVYRFKFVTMRYSNVFGPRQLPHGEASVVPTFMLRILEGKSPIIFGDGSMLRDYTFVSDIAQANIAALTRGTGEAFNIGNGKPISVLQLYRAIAKEMKFSGKARFAAARPGDIRFNYLSVEKAKRLLGWEAKVSLAEGLSQTAAYLKASS
jgi:UDP-glucose 4-epimerase